MRRHVASDEVPTSFDAAAKTLHVLAMRYPASAAPLAQGAFTWDVPPLRASGEAAVTHALCAWTEQTSEAADSALFSSMGLWISPFTVHCTVTPALIFALLVQNHLSTGFHQISPAAALRNVCMVIGLAAVPVLLGVHHREQPAGRVGLPRPCRRPAWWPRWRSAPASAQAPTWRRTRTAATLPCVTTRGSMRFRSAP